MGWTPYPWCSRLLPQASWFLHYQGCYFPVHLLLIVQPSVNMSKNNPCTPCTSLLCSAWCLGSCVGLCGRFHMVSVSYYQLPKRLVWPALSTRCSQRLHRAPQSTGYLSIMHAWLLYIVREQVNRTYTFCRQVC